MASFRYSALHLEAREIRLVKLLPGIADHPLCVEIAHAALAPALQKTDGGIPMAALQSTLPRDWKVHDSIDGRYIFEKGENEVFS